MRDWPEPPSMLIAIDPGAAGGIAWKVGYSVSVGKMPDTPKDIYLAIEDLKSHHDLPVRAVMEKVGYHVQGNSASSSCKFARHCGHIEMALLALNIPFLEVTPQKWMKAIGALPKDKTARKRRIKDVMQRRHPHIRVTLWNADALGILAWAENNK